jgi:cellulose biosynthesis protein BcsQ
VDGGFDLLPSNSELTAAEVELLSIAMKEQRLRLALATVKDRYDFVIIDCGAADVSSLAKITTPTTITVINAMNENNASVRKAAISLEQAGFDLPLVIHPSDHEREAMGTVAA